MKENGWEQWSQYVIKSIEQLSVDIKDLDTHLHQLRMKDIEPLKVKVAIIGIIGGFAGGVAYLFISSAIHQWILRP